MCGSSGDGKQDGEVISKRPKQTLISLTILSFTLVTATSNGLYRIRDYRAIPVSLPVPAILLMFIITEWKGRKVLFIALYLLSLISSLVYLSQSKLYDYQALCALIHIPVQESSIFLLYIIISEYCDPKRRFLILVANSAIQMLFYWVTFVLLFDQKRLEFFGTWLQYGNVSLAVFGLWSVFRWPESPYWLAFRRRFQESAKAFVEVRGESDSEEFRELTSGKSRPGSYKMVLIPLLLALPILLIAMPTNGAIEFYNSLLLIRVGISIEPYWIFLISNFIAATLSVLTVLIPIRVPRKVLFLSCFSLYFTTELLFIYFAFAGVPVLGLCTEIILDYGPRLLSVPLLVEIIPQKFSTPIVAFLTILYSVVQYLLTDCDMEFIFIKYLIGFSLFFLICVVTGYFIIPETREKSLLEIEQLYVLKQDKPSAIQTDL